jgi:hypothetical protein
MDHLVTDHLRKVQAGEIVSIQPNAVSISDGIDLALQDLVGSLLMHGEVALKTAQDVTRLFDVNIGAMFSSFRRDRRRLRFEDCLVRITDPSRDSAWGAESGAASALPVRGGTARARYMAVALQ